MKEPAEYLKDLAENNPESFNVVSAHMVRDQFGIAHPNDGSVCDPPCTGNGGTPNGYYVCNSGKCHWVVIV